MRASIRQVAQAAGVSPMTVSNVLRGRTDIVVEQTRERVLQAARDLNYVPVRTSTQNRHVRTNAIGVVFLHSHRPDGPIGYPTFLGMYDRARELDHDLTIFLRAEPDWVKPGTEAQFLDRRCDGFIFVGSNRPEITTALTENKVPSVECYSVAPAPGAARVVADNAGGIRQAVMHLANHGHKRIAHIAGPQWNLEAQERLKGFRAAMQEQFGPDCWDCVIHAETWGQIQRFHNANGAVDDVTLPIVEAALATGATAFVCANDLLALALWQFAEDRGLRIPRDLSIIGVDNILQADYQGLTSIDIPFEEIGRAAVDAVLALEKGDSTGEASRILPVELIPRSSVTVPSER
ncbi:LacI family transcriptional regulator [Capsulimonas corticalis]|uniref:LacI family transcriptional regulator n=1 Tax=Capsulimonas corticalis TaxID=2219043 RepID=A0A402CTV1_9BACT|nr:LacI family DNA-binding transcriptional regulator [Capsulimonas corticalis]BDI28784.1 LacI family transcriptional regulator [Capsulimonas corticalis]